VTDTDALLATVRGILPPREAPVGPYSVVPNVSLDEAHAALDSLAAELEQRDARIAALYAAVELIQTERDQAQHERSVATDWAAELAGKKREAETELERVKDERDELERGRRSDANAAARMARAPVFLSAQADMRYLFEQLQTERELAAWIIRELYDGGSWSRMEAQRPEINEFTDRIGAWKEEE